MPFTFAHPFFAVPLRRIKPKWVSVTGLILGSMSPDMEYFVAMEPYQSIGHSILGFLIQGLPLCIAFAFVFHYMIKPVLPKFLPSFGRMDQFVSDLCVDWKLDSARAWIVFLGSLLIGYWTHMFVDAWTHVGGIFVEWFPFLREYHGHSPLYSKLQIDFSIVGLLIPGLLLLYRYVRFIGMTRSTVKEKLAAPSTKIALWFVLLVTTSIVYKIKMMVIHHRHDFVSTVVVAPLSSLLFGFYVASLLYWAVKKQRVWYALGSLALIVAVIIALRVGSNLRDDLLSNGIPYKYLHPPKGVFDPLWNGFLICWSAALLLSSRIVTRSQHVVKGLFQLKQ
ncbi:DUF4184 family protein [Paenibacillus sp. BC26]|uniref:DUF4184 family protein n=1 Tax=Paenibacillus sp. BC26 TaxID=1881032 RepID=UPI0008E7DE24|nr:DUF4184 family protein [Paenibacillus sp. BC26]SFS75716.1 protein of unknown function [Paenibacillus sp. BC26]